MFEVRIEVDFPAAHHLLGYSGDCARLHGHNWKMEVFARASELDKVGMAIDFRILKQAAKELVARWDHQDLNTVEDFKGLNPTAENIAKVAFERLSEKLSKTITAASISKVTVWENERCSATYFQS